MTEEVTEIQETPTPEVTGAPADQVTDPAPVESVDTTAKEPEKTGVQKRIDELTFKQREAEREADYWKQQAQTQQSPEQPKPNGKPSLDQFDDYEGYVEALAGYQAEKKFADLQAQQSVATQQAQQASRSQDFRQRADAFSTEHPDFNQVVFENRYLPITDGMKEVIEASEKGPELAYHLGQNPQDAARIAQLSPTMAAMELGKLESMLSIPKAPKTPGAPPPITPIGGGDASVKTPSKMTMEEYAAYYKSNIQR